MSTNDPFADVPVVRTPSGRERMEIDYRLPSGARVTSGAPNDTDYADSPYMKTRDGHSMRAVRRIRGGISQNQFGYIIDLLHKKQRPNEAEVPNDEVIASAYQATMAQASKVATTTTTTTDNRRRWQVVYEDVNTDRGIKRIGYLTDAQAEIPAGYYALDTSQDTAFVNDVTFFKIWIGTRHGWKLFMLKSDEEIELQRGHQVGILKRIAANPSEAMRLYGKHKSRCGICHRRLTNDESRTYGIGPICRARWGF
jgi:hypothetical protein